MLTIFQGVCGQNRNFDSEIYPDAYKLMLLHSNKEWKIPVENFYNHYGV